MNKQIKEALEAVVSARVPAGIVAHVMRTMPDNDLAALANAVATGALGALDATTEARELRRQLSAARHLAEIERAAAEQSRKERDLLRAALDEARAELDAQDGITCDTADRCRCLPDDADAADVEFSCECDTTGGPGSTCAGCGAGIITTRTFETRHRPDTRDAGRRTEAGAKSTPPPAAWEAALRGLVALPGLSDAGLAAAVRQGGNVELAALARRALGGAGSGVVTRVENRSSHAICVEGTWTIAGELLLEVVDATAPAAPDCVTVPTVLHRLEDVDPTRETRADGPRRDRCLCGGIILADAEHWRTPVCPRCFDTIRELGCEPHHPLRAIVAYRQARDAVCVVSLSCGHESHVHRIEAAPSLGAAWPCPSCAGAGASGAS